MSSKDNNDFNLINEISRGCLYRGGPDMQSFLNGYAWGAFWMGGLLVALFLISWLKGY